MSRFLATIFGFLLSVSAAFSEPVRTLETPGADADLRQALAATSLVISAGADADSQELLAGAQADYGRLLGVLYSNARYGGVISIKIDGREAASIAPLAPPSAFANIVVRVEPGPVYLFSTADIAPTPRGTALPPQFAQGQPGSTDAIRAASEATIAAWRAEGNAKARATDQRIVARHADARIDAAIRIDPGPRLNFGDIGVSGNENVGEARIRKIAGLEDKQRFDPVEIDRAVNRLRRTGSFSSVTVSEASDIGPNNTLDLDIEVVEATPRRFGFGAEISTIDGLGLSGFWLHRNFLGGAERFRIDGAISGLGGETAGVDFDFGVRYERPATPKADIDLFAEYRFEHLDEPDFRSDTSEFTLGFTRYATDDLVVTFGLGYLFSDVEDALGRETFQLITLPLGAVYDRRDDALSPKAGFFIDLEATPFAGLSGTSSGGQLKLDARAYHSPTERLTFAGRLQLGALFGPGLTESPPFYRFYSGGGGTVRGQDYQSLDIDLGGGIRSGGRSFVGLSGELRAGITDDIEAVGFVDWGYIGAEQFPDFTGDSHAGAGIGLRYNTGIGPIRLDLGTPIFGDTTSSGIYIYVGIGQSF